MAEGGRKRQFGGEGYDGDFKKRRYDGPMGGEGEMISAPPATLRILVRNQDAGAIIGKGGENIKRLRKTYDCHVVLPDSAGAPERVMTMMGAIASLVGVLGDVLPTLGSSEDYQQDTREVQVLIPQPFMGTIIGTGGGKIKDLRTKTSCAIKIFSEAMPNSNERSIQLIGPVEQIKECVLNFLDDISKKTPREPIYLYEPGYPDGPVGGDFPPPPPGGRGGGGSFRGRGYSRGGGRGNYYGRGRGGGHYNGRGSSQSYGSPAPRPPYPAQQTAPPPAPATYTGPPPAVGYTATAGAPPPGPTPPQQPSNPPAPPTGSQYTPPAAVPPYPSPQPSGPAPLQPSGPPVNPPPLITQTQQVTIPCEFAEAILGHDGSKLRQIKSQSACEIAIADPKPGVNERIITITGATENIQFAQQLMQSSVREHHNV